MSDYMSSLMRYAARYGLFGGAFSESTSGDKIVVAQQTADEDEFFYVVISYALVAASAVLATWKSGSTELGAALNTGTVGIMAPENIWLGHVRTAAGEDLVLNLATNVDVRGYINAVKVPVNLS